MAVFYEMEFDKSGDVRNVGHIRILKASGTSCCSGDNPETFCESCKAEIDTDFAELKANKVEPVVYYHIPSTGELIRRPEPKAAKRKLTPAEQIAYWKSLSHALSNASKDVPPADPVNASGVPDAPNLVAAVRKRKKQTKTKSERLLERARKSSGVPEPKSMEDILGSKK